MKQDPPSFESTMSVDETDPVGPSSLKTVSEVVNTIDPESTMCQVDAAVAASKSLLEEDDEDDYDVSAKSGASEERDQPHMGTFSCQPYDPLQWEAIYNATLCHTNELGEQLEMMTVSVKMCL
jgi:G3E family GTPase